MDALAGARLSAVTKSMQEFLRRTSDDGSNSIVISAVAPTVVGSLLRSDKRPA